MMKRGLCAAVLWGLALVAGFARAEPRIERTPIADGLSWFDELTLRGPKHFVDDYSPRTESGLVRAVVEIPAGTVEKWEVDKRDGGLKWEIKDGKPRIVNFLPYPANYGMVPRTLLPKDRGGDGDPLDIVILSPAVPRGSILEVKVLGVLKLTDEGEVDDKLVAVEVGRPLGDSLDLNDLGRKHPGVLEIVEAWMTNYKGFGVLVSKGYAGPAEAERTLDAAIRAYSKVDRSKP